LIGSRSRCSRCTWRRSGDRTQQGLDGATLVHRTVDRIGPHKWHGEAQDLAWVDPAVGDAFDQVEQFITFD
jgi:hypothetical protein